MTEQSTFFVVERTPIGESAAIYYDRLPARFTGKNAVRNGLVYIVRMDILPNGKTWMAMSLAQLYAAYRIARDRGSLPASNIAGPPRKQEPAKPLHGHRETMIRARPWAGVPDEPFPTVAELDQRAAKRLSEAS